MPRDEYANITRAEYDLGDATGQPAPEPAEIPADADEDPYLPDDDDDDEGDEDF